VADRHMNWAREVYAQLQARGLRIEVDESSEKLGAKIRDAQLIKVPYTLVIGDKEVEGKGVSPRRHGEGKEADLGFHGLDAFAAQLSSEAAAPF
jgi:threonyl-tRNA synthetase